MTYGTLAYGLEMNTEKYFGLNSTRYIKNSEDLTRALTDHKLNFHVESVQMKHPTTDEPIPYFATMRTDTGAILGAGLSDRYKPIQNADGFAMVADLGQQNKDGAIFARGMTFDKGRVAVAQIDLGEMVIGDTGRHGFRDAVRRRITWTNSHDGTGAAHIFTTPIRVVCANTLTAAISSAKDKISIRHTSSAPERMEEAAEVLRLVDGMLVKTEKAYNSMAAARVYQDSFEEVLRTLWPTEGLKGRPLKNAIDSKTRVSRYFKDADGGRIERDTAWNLYNAITRYNDHDTTVRTDGDARGYSIFKVARDEARQESTLMGGIAKKNRRALEVITEVFDIDSILKETERRLKAEEMPTALAQACTVDQILSMVEV